MLLEYAGSTKEPSEVQVEVPELGGVTWLNPAHLQPVRFICYLIILVPLHCPPPCPRRPPSQHLLQRVKYSTRSSLTCSKAKSYSLLEVSTFPMEWSRPDERRSKWDMLHHHRDPHASRSRCSHCRKRVSSCGLSPRS